MQGLNVRTQVLEENVPNIFTVRHAEITNQLKVVDQVLKMIILFSLFFFLSLDSLIVGWL